MKNWILCVCLLYSVVLGAKELKKTFIFKDFENAKKNVNRLQFIVESTKGLFFSSDVDGYAKQFSYTADYDEKNQILRNMRIVLKTASMDTNDTDRDEKLHRLCLSTEKYPEIVVSVAGPLFLKSARMQKLKGKAQIRGLSKDFEIELSASAGNKNSVKIEGKSSWSLKEMQIPDPSIVVATLSDEIRILLSLKLQLK